MTVLDWLLIIVGLTCAGVLFLPGIVLVFACVFQRWRDLGGKPPCECPPATRPSGPSETEGEA